MKKKEKIDFLETFLNNRYDSIEYSKFLIHILNVKTLEKIAFTGKKNLNINEKYKDFIINCTEFYRYQENGKKIAILEIELNYNFQNFPEKDRPFISSLMKNLGYDYILVAFYTKNSSIWNLSFVKKLDFTLELKDETNQLNSIKRISYSLGNKAFTLFSKEQFIEFIRMNNPPLLKFLYKIFSLEKLTKSFFEDYKELYLELKDFLDQNYENLCGISSETYTKLFLEKEVFSYFLEKKTFKLQNNFSILKDLFPLETLNLNCKKTRVSQVFNKYEFTLKENEPYEIQLAVDPEMLGKVFENLLEIKDKRSKGVFYTPREIVHYISKETIFYSLLKHFPLAEKNDLYALVFLRDFLEEDINSFKMPKFVQENAFLLDNVLKNLKIIDPATGSGAFPIGILHEIVNIRKSLTQYILLNTNFTLENTRNLYNLKKETIENSIYGIDIESHPVEITKLRLYLSLLSSAKDKFDFFSSLKFNFLVANALTKAFSKDSFDIVIGNPPYVGEKGNKDIFREISLSSLGKRFYMGKGDLLYLFFHLGLDLLKDKGVLGFITTSYYLTADGAKNLREDLKNRSNLLNLINFNNLVVFEKAKGQHNLVTLLEKNSIKNRGLGTIICDKNIDLTLEDLDDIFFKTSKKVSYNYLDSSEIYDGENSYIRIEKNDITAILEKMKSSSILLKNSFSVKQGIVSGADRVSKAHRHKFLINEEVDKGIFVLNEKEIKKLNLTKKELTLIKPFYKNSDIYSYANSEIPKLWIIYLTKNEDIENYPNIKKHLLKYKKILENKREFKSGRLPWYSLNWSRDINMFISPKIITRQRCKNNMFSYNEIEWFSSADVYYINPINSNFNLKYLLALLNSKLFFLWFYKYGKRKGELLELYSTPLEELPIKKISIYLENKIVSLVDKILIKKKLNENSQDLENELEDIICGIYSLSTQEKSIVQSFFNF